MTAVVDRAPSTLEDPTLASPPAGRPLEIGLLLLPLAVAVAAVQPLSDPDVWWHLRTGELIVDQGLVGTDPWSFATTKPWLLHEWVPEVVMYAAHAVAGYPGVIAWAALTVAVFAGVVVASCRRVAHPMIACVSVALVSLATLPSLAPRPQLVSWVLLAAVCPYMRSSIEHRRLPWWLPPIIWVWANIHGLWVTALVLFGFLVIGLVIEEGTRGWRTSARFCGFGLLSLAAAAVTPSGPKLLMAPLHVREYARFVSEWAPPSIVNPAVASALALVLVVIVGWARQGQPVPATTISFVVGATAVGLLYSRTVPILAIAVAPLAAAAAQSWLSDAVPRFRFDARESLTWVIVVLLAVPLIAGRLVTVTDTAPGKHLGTTNSAVLAATEALERLPGRARVLNEYELGGWLLWAARDTSPAIDGRADVYSVQHFEEYTDALAMRPGWQRFVSDLDVDAAVLRRGTPLTGGLEGLGWTVVSEEDDLVVLAPPAAEE